MSDTAPEAPAQEPTDTDTPTEEVSTDDLKAQLEKLQRESRKWEERAKANSAAAKELEAAKLAALSDAEKAVEVARLEGRREAFATLGGQVIETTVTAALAGRGIDAKALLDGIDTSRFLTEDGAVDVEAVNAWVDRIAPKPLEPTFPDLGQGRRGSTTPLGSDPLLDTLKQSIGIR